MDKRTDRDWNVLLRPKAWDEIVGQTHLIGVFNTMIMAGTFPSFTILAGPSGVGKSLLAEVIGKSICCSGEGTKPCGRCQSCLSFNDGRSLNVVKYDMPNLQSSEIDRVIENVFRVENVGTKVFIFEEAHVMDGRQSQTKFLENLTRIPKDVYLIWCTTHLSGLIEEIRNRASIFYLESPSEDECLKMVHRIGERFRLGLPNDAILCGFIRSNKNCPRMIIQAMEVLASADKFDIDSIKQLYRLSDDEYCGSVFCSLIDKSVSLYEFIRLIKKTELNGYEILRGIREFALNILVEISLNEHRDISEKQREKVQSIIDQNGEGVFLKIFDSLGRLPHYGEISDAEVIFRLTHMKLGLLGLSLGKLAENNNSEAASQKMSSLSKSTEVQKQKREIKSAKTHGYVSSKDEILKIIG